MRVRQPEQRPTPRSHPTTATSTAGTTLVTRGSTSRTTSTADADDERGGLGLVEVLEPRDHLGAERRRVGREPAQLRQLPDDDRDREAVHVADLDLARQQIGDEPEPAQPQADLDERRRAARACPRARRASARRRAPRAGRSRRRSAATPTSPGRARARATARRPRSRRGSRSSRRGRTPAGTPASSAYAMPCGTRIAARTTPATRSGRSQVRLVGARDSRTRAPIARPPLAPAHSASPRRSASSSARRTRRDGRDRLAQEPAREHVARVVHAGVHAGEGHRPGQRIDGQPQLRDLPAITTRRTRPPKRRVRTGTRTSAGCARRRDAGTT